MLKCFLHGSSRIPTGVARSLFVHSLIHSFNNYVLISLSVLGAKDRTQSKAQTLI